MLFSNRWQNRLLFSLHSSLLQKSLYSGGLQLPSLSLCDPCGKELFNWVISSDLLPLNDPDIPTLQHRSSPDISSAPFSLALSCTWGVLQDLSSDHLPILLSVPLSPVFCPNEHNPSFNFQKARWDGFACYFESHCASADEYLSLSSAAAFFSSLALNAAKSPIPFGCNKCHAIAWWSAEVEEVVSERRKAFANAHGSNEDRQAYISASQHASSVIAKAKAEAWQTTCSSLSPKSNPKSVYSLRSIKITKVIPFESVEVFRKNPFLALYFSLSSLMIFWSFCLLPSAALFMLTIWPFGPPPPLYPLRWKPHKQLCFDWCTGLSTGVFLSI